jgi:hypothetical protein
MAKKKKSVSGSPFVLILVVLLLIAATAGGSFFYYQLTHPHTNELTALENHLAPMIALPDEQPTLATVSDVKKLPHSSFFQNAANGDKVLVYPVSQKAILYRPATGKIIEVGLVSGK